MSETGIQIDRQGDVIRLTLLDDSLAGEETIRLFRRQMRVIIEKVEHPRVAIDMSQVKYVSSAGIGELVGASKKVDRMNGKLCLGAVTPAVMEIFTITRIDKAVRIESSIDRAILRVTPRSQH